MFDNIDYDDCYKPSLVKSSFKENYKYYESRGDKDKKLSSYCLNYLHSFRTDNVLKQ